MSELVELWLHEGNGVEPQVANELLSVLADTERNHADTFRSEPEKAQFCLTRALLRAALSRRTGLAAREFRFEADVHGKPHIAAPAGARQVQFSVAHTPGLSACVIACRSVGVDVECTRRLMRLETLARWFSKGEQRELSALSAEQQSARLFRYWTLKEAYAKACGLGLDLPFAQIEVHSNGNELKVVFLPERGHVRERWQFMSWRATRFHQVALVVSARDSAPIDVRVFSGWPGTCEGTLLPRACIHG
ncbi:MAG: 4'-phosphopantetheinyl transferase family protein [Myxococcota bacterium]